jgi:hypothetical protein
MKVKTNIKAGQIAVVNGAGIAGASVFAEGVEINQTF